MIKLKKSNNQKPKKLSQLFKELTMADKLHPSLTKDTTEEFKRKLESKSVFGASLSKIKDIKGRYDAFLYELKVSSNHHA
jgi:hypothetical protein